MGVALFIVPERDVPGLDVFVNGKALAHVRDLDRIASEAGVKPLMEFFSIAPEEAGAMLEDCEVEPPEGGFPPEQWFSAEDGLVSVRGLITYFQADPAAISERARKRHGYSVDDVIEDLRGFEEVLSALAAENVRWHLAVDA